MVSKRRFLRGAKMLALVGAAMALAGCTTSGSSSSNVSGTQVLLDIQGGLNELQIIMSALGSAMPAGVVSTVNSTLTQAENAFATLTTEVSSIADATTIQQIVAWVEGIVSALTPVLGVLPGASAYLAAAAAVAALLPSVIAFVQSILNPSGPAPAAIAWPRGLIVPPPTIARQQLHIPGLVHA